VRFLDIMKVSLSAYFFTFAVLLAILSTARTSALCPSGCDCTGGAPATKLAIDCLRAPDINAEQFSQQLDRLLSSNLTVGHMSWLSISNTPVARVPRSVCRLTTLTQLHLDLNRLSRLPDNCLTNLTALRSLTATHNHITELQDGLFDGLDKLQTLRLDYNHISSIGLRVFNSSARLTSLKGVYLKKNRIQTLEPWFYYIAVNGQLKDRSHIDLKANNISSFTNKMGLEAKCGMKIMKTYLILSYNHIKHLSDIFHGWNISLITWWCWSPFQSDGKPSSYISIGYNPIVCDCVDFTYYKLLGAPIKSTLPDNTYCNSPRSLYGRRVTSVRLDELVCELTSRCPSACRCVHRPANSTLHVYCSNTNLTALPLELPQLPKSYTKYKLDFSNNPLLRRLEHRHYFVNTYTLDVSNCNLDSVDFRVWKDLVNITQVFLDGNQLRSLPSSVAGVGAGQHMANISLGRNPWECSCDASWMPKWLRSFKGNLINPNDMTCSSPSRLKNRNIASIDGKVFCENPVSEAVRRTLTIIMTSVAGVLILLLSVAVIVYRLRVKLYSRWKFQPFDRDECLGEDMDYDVFLSCSSSDNLPHGNEIRERLEELGYRVCYPPRDFLAGDTIHENIYRAVVRSKRTVCFLTARFLGRFVSIVCILVLYQECFRVSR